MNTTFRISVRELVAFTYFAPDIMPTSMALLAEGTRAHQGRQRSLPTGFEIERPVQATVEHQGASVTVYGRMDAFYPGEGTPLVEEIKLGDGTTLLPAHRAQAVLYATMLALNEGYHLVKVKVSYVSEEGHLQKAYEETLESTALSDQLHALLNPYVCFALAESQHQALRDESLQTLRFPFAAYRAGQREMAVQVFTAISKRKRLFSSLPTGTGKSAAVLYPALKALGQGKTGKLLYLTARTTTRQSPLNVLERMLSQGLVARISVLTAKEKLCPVTARCHPDACPRAKGHYLRLAGAIDEIRGRTGLWTDDVICALAHKHQLCPFELALSLCELADVVLMDYNYAFDPYAQVQRLFQRRRDMTLLIDEAHHLLERARDMLSGDLDTRTLKRYRQRFAKAAGRKNDFYRSLTKLIHLLQALQESSGNRLSSLPKEIDAQVRATLAQASGLLASALPGGEAMQEVAEVLRLMMAFTYASDHLGEEYAILLDTSGAERTLSLYCLLPGKEIARITKHLRGTVFFSATLSPLRAMRALLGGDEDDACFSLPSPFPPEHLMVVRKRIQTTYRMREQTASQVAQSIAQALRLYPGKQIAYFPSYAYLRRVLQELERMEDLSLLVQEGDMDEAQRERFLSAFTTDEKPLLGLCVLGGLFSEGIDLPGKRLVGAIIVGVGLPTPSCKLRSIQDECQKRFGDGFHFASRIPGMQKVVQAAGRVVRTEKDCGLVLLIDARYYEADYTALLPESWQLINEDIAVAVQRLKEGSQ